MIRILEEKDAGALLKRKAARLDEAMRAVEPILEAVRRRGDAAVREYAKKFDGFAGRQFRIADAELEAARRQVTPAFQRAVQTAARNIRAYASRQLPKPFRVKLANGLVAGQVVRPLETVACYIPSGRYPLPSTVMMTALPALAAGVPNVCIAVSRPVPEILATAAITGVHQAFQAGGAHAIAAFAFGTRTIPKADAIVGPGNIYVAAAKKMLAGDVKIDFVAGPTEILIIAAEGDARWIAADMLAQAEHDTDASAVLLTTSAELARAVAAELEAQLATLPTAPVARRAIQRNSAILVVRSLEAAVELSNRFAPEHLSLHDARLLPLVQNAGGVFLGAMSPEAAGDYAAGPNHVLPTSGSARVRGGLSAADFVKVVATQSLSSRALKALAPAITTLARAEGLEAHARSVEVRLA